MKNGEKVGQEIKHYRFYIDLGSWGDLDQTLEFFEELAASYPFPIYATLQTIRLADNVWGFRIGLAHKSELALSIIPEKWVRAVQARLVPSGFMDSDEITVNREVDWMVKDLNPGLIGDYSQGILKGSVTNENH